MAKGSCIYACICQFINLVTSRHITQPLISYHMIILSMRWGVRRLLRGESSTHENRQGERRTRKGESTTCDMTCIHRYSTSTKQGREVREWGREALWATSILTWPPALIPCRIYIWQYAFNGCNPAGGGGRVHDGHGCSKYWNIRKILTLSCVCLHHLWEHSWI